MHPNTNMPNNNMVHFKGSPKGEEIFINGKHHTIGIGGIISDLMALPPQFDTHADAVLEFLVSITNGTLPMEELKCLPAQITDLETSAVLRDILLWQPLGKSGISDVIEHEKNLHTTKERKCYYETANPKSEPDAQTTALRKRNVLKWQYFSDLILGTGSIGTKEELEVYKICLELYHQEFEALISDIHRIRTHLSEFLEGSLYEKKDAKATIYRVGSQIEIFYNPKNDTLFKKNQQKKYSQIFIAGSLYSLVALELNLMDELFREFSKCKLCGRYFVPYTSRSVYCRNPNPEYNNRPCSKIGPNQFYRKSRNNDLLKQEYDQNYNAYRKWRKENMEKYYASNDDDIADEIDAVFEQWLSSAKQATKLFECGDLSYDEAWKIIQMPEKSNRSEKWHKLKTYGYY